MKDKENEIKLWLKNVIIGLNLCPFAQAPFEKDLIFIECSKASDDQKVISSFLDHLERVQSKRPDEIATSLLAFPNLEMSFENFYAISESLENILEDLKLEDHFQIVTFHPEFYFEGLAKDCKANYVNRSPYPLFHLLRKVDLEMLNLSEDEAKEISFNNERKLLELDQNIFNNLFK